MRVLCAALLVLLFTPALAVAINAQAMGHAKFEVTQAVSVQTNSGVKALNVTLMVPQDKGNQRVISMESNASTESITDEWGNRMLLAKFEWPPENTTFWVKSVVEVDRQTTAYSLEDPEFLKSSALIESTDQAIIEFAGRLTAGHASDWEKLSKITEWVHENIKYDLDYANVNMSAKSTLELRRGVCDEFSTLQMALLRSAGWPAAYVAGYAWGTGQRVAEDFVPHGWVEACSPTDSQDCWVMDPTWAEAGWLDAMHIKFARLPDSYFTEAAVSAIGMQSIIIKNITTETRIRALSTQESVLVSAHAQLLDPIIWNGWAAMRVDLSALGCVLTKMGMNSCVGPDNKTMLEPLFNESIISFCGNKSVFVLFRVPEGLNENMHYTCPLSVLPGAGEQVSADVELRANEKATWAPLLSIDRTSVKYGEKISVGSPGAHIFTDFGAYAVNRTVLSAPADSFTVWAYRDGLLAEQKINIETERPLDIRLELNATSLVQGNAVGAAVTVKNLAGAAREVSVRLGNQSLSATLAPGESRKFEFTHKPAAQQDRLVQAYASVDGWVTSASQEIEVKAPPKGLLEQITDLISRLFRTGLYMIYQVLGW